MTWSGGGKKLLCSWLCLGGAPRCTPPLSLCRWPKGHSSFAKQAATEWVWALFTLHLFFHQDSHCLQRHM